MQRAPFLAGSTQVNTSRSQSHRQKALTSLHQDEQKSSKTTHDEMTHWQDNAMMSRGKCRSNRGTLVLSPEKSSTFSPCSKHTHYVEICHPQNADFFSANR